MQYLNETSLLNFNEESIQNLIHSRKWDELDTFHRIQASYNFVKDEILFGYNKENALSASVILKDGYGQCNTKSILFMALLRALGVPCRIHGYMINKLLQKGAMTGFIYQNAPTEILHSVVEVLYNDTWLELEGLILDVEYLEKLQRKFAKRKYESFIGYGVATKDFNHPPVYFNGNNTYIQSEGIIKDLGVYDDPDALFKEHQQPIGKFKKWVYVHIARKKMNRNIAKIRTYKN